MIEGCYSADASSPAVAVSAPPCFCARADGREERVSHDAEYAGAEKNHGVDDFFVDQYQFQTEPFVRSKKLNFQTGSTEEKRADLSIKKKGSPTDGFGGNDAASASRDGGGLILHAQATNERVAAPSARSKNHAWVTSASGRAKGQALAFSGPSAATRPRGKRNDDLPMELIRFHRASASATLARPIGEEKRDLTYLLSLRAGFFSLLRLLRRCYPSAFALVHVPCGVLVWPS